MKLKDKVAIITGSSRGIGKATALLFTKEGAKVVINCKQDVTRGQQVVDEITRSGGKAILVQADISKEEDVKELFQHHLIQQENDLKRLMHLSHSTALRHKIFLYNYD